jgi:hypothetical protein
MAAKGASLGCAAAAGKPSGVLPMKNRFTVSRAVRRMYYGAVPEIKKGIPDERSCLAAPDLRSLLSPMVAMFVSDGRDARHA